MAISYAQSLSADMLLSEVEALMDWRHQIIRKSFYPDAPAKQLPALQAPSRLLAWCRQESERGTMDKKLVERLALVHEELCKVGRHLLEMPPPAPLQTYDGFENQFEAYLTQIRRLQQDVADAAGAVDMITGLRTVSGMRVDLKREQDRYDRKGTAFSVANVEIDGIDDVQQKHDRRAQDAIYATIAQMIARTIRSFDDAYYLGKGEYMIVLKHVEFMDACAVMDRLRNDIDAAFVMLPSGEKIKVTCSFGVAEAQQRESIEVALDHAKAALLEAKGLGGNRVSEFHERSALEQYAKDIKK